MEYQVKYQLDSISWLEIIQPGQLALLMDFSNHKAGVPSARQPAK
jgi:hypothetical protein